MENITFANVCNNYFLYIKLKKKPQSFRSITSRINNYILPYFSNTNIFDFTAFEFLEWQNMINSKNLSYKYKKTLHYAFVGLLNYCKIFYNLDKNVASEVGNFKNYEVESIAKVWTYEQFKKFIEVVDVELYKTLFKFMYFTGCRIGEILALTWNDLEKNIIHINKTISKENINGHRVITPPKTKKSIRKICIDNHLLLDLYNLKNYYANLYDNYSIDYYIFGGNKPLSPSTIERYKNKYCKISGVEKIRLHDFRHSHATLLLKNNIPISTISKRLGHKNTSTTLDIYAHFVEEDEKRVLDTLNSLTY